MKKASWFVKKEEEKEVMKEDQMEKVFVLVSKPIDGWCPLHWFEHARVLKSLILWHHL